MLITSLTQKIEDWATETGITYRLAAQYYRDVIHNEVVLANITKDDHILCIGGGICPFSAILFHQTTGAKVTVIDNNSDCIPKARHVIQRLGLGQYVHVLHQDGSHAMNFLDYTIVHFALQVCPMECVFNHVESKVPPGTKLLVRRPKPRLKSLYSRITKEVFNHCPIIIHKKARNIGSTILYIKQERGNEKTVNEKTAAFNGTVTSSAISSDFYAAAV